MKSAYELAMERLAKDSPEVTLTEDQKAQLAEIDKKYKAKIAEREVYLSDQIAKAEAAGNFAERSEPANNLRLRCNPLVRLPFHAPSKFAFDLIPLPRRLDFSYSRHE